MSFARVAFGRRLPRHVHEERRDGMHFDVFELAADVCGTSTGGSEAA